MSESFLASEAIFASRAHYEPSGTPMRGRFGGGRAPDDYFAARAEPAEAPPAFFESRTMAGAENAWTGRGDQGAG
eukprot:gene4361-14482_t